MPSSIPYQKCACTHCGGHVEFPSEAAGATVPCPHCGKDLSLANPRPRFLRKRILLPFLFSAAGVMALFCMFTLSAARHTLVIQEVQLTRASPNTAGAVSGFVLNRSSKTSYRVRVEIELVNARGDILWQASDYAPEIRAGERWHFHAAVLDSAVVTTGKLTIRRSRE